MATPHADFQAKRCSEAPEIQRLSRVWVCGALPLTLSADACTASKGLQMGYDGERARGWCRIVACPSQTLPTRPSRDCRSIRRLAGDRFTPGLQKN
jgi:hypothetical protein